MAFIPVLTGNYSQNSFIRSDSFNKQDFDSLETYFINSKPKPSLSNYKIVGNQSISNSLFEF